MALEVTGQSADSAWPSRTARWTDGLAVATPESGRLRAMHWAHRAIRAAAARGEVDGDDAFATWTAAVEAVWWVAALDDLLDEIVGKTAYRAARAADDCGRVVLGLRWLRHLHIHEIAVTGTGGPKRPFFPPPGASYVLYISPFNQWLPAIALKPPENDQNLSLREDCDAVVAGLPLSQERTGLWCGTTASCPPAGSLHTSSLMTSRSCSARRSLPVTRSAPRPGLGGAERRAVA